MQGKRSQLSILRHIPIDKINPWHGRHETLSLVSSVGFLAKMSVWDKSSGRFDTISLWFCFWVYFFIKPSTNGGKNKNICCKCFSPKDPATHVFILADSPVSICAVENRHMEVAPAEEKPRIRTQLYTGLSHNDLVAPVWPRFVDLIALTITQIHAPTTVALVAPNLKAGHSVWRKVLVWRSFGLGRLKTKALPLASSRWLEKLDKQNKIQVQP